LRPTCGTRTVSKSVALLDLLRIDVPIIQAPMAGVSSPAMAAAVANAGGLGSLGVGATDAAGTRTMIAAVRERTNRSFNVNVFCHQPAQPNAEIEAAWIERLRPEFERLGATPPAELKPIYKSFLEDDDMLAVLLEARPPVVSFHFGVPFADRVRALRDAGIILLGCATSLSEARAVVAAGAHAVIAQGYEAGGHRGVFDPNADDRLGTMALTRLFVRHLDLPVIAAGGIMDGTGIAAVLRLGAGAAQLGTAFVTTDESLAGAAYRAAMASNAANHTVVTSVISGRPARCLANRFTALGVDGAEIPSYPITYDAGKALNAAGNAAGESGYGAHWAGQGAPLARSMSAGTLMAALIAEMNAAT
jgi:nitronate monooxygenase